MNEYIGHDTQLFGVEEHRLCGGKGDGMRLLQVNNGDGLMFTISVDRCGDISRLYFDGKNLSFFSPCGYVSPEYYDDKGLGFLKSFTAGFFTTCGLNTIGNPSCDEGEELPLHGTISNAPAENVGYWIENEEIHIKLMVRDAGFSGHKMMLEREYVCPLYKNEIIIKDKVKNIGYTEAPYMILYHMNMGYPLLSENSVVTLKHKGCTPRNERAAEGIERALTMEKPQLEFEEQCYFYDMTEGVARIYNPDIKIGLSINYDVKELPYFVEWKMMEKGCYVLGLEPGNCSIDGRDAARKEGILPFLKSGEEATQTLTIKLERD